MGPPAVVHDSDDVSSALEILVQQGTREVVVVDYEERIVGFLDENEITRLYHVPTRSLGADGDDRAPATSRPPPPL
jgi:hypothetical protein